MSRELSYLYSLINRYLFLCYNQPSLCKTTIYKQIFKSWNFFLNVGLWSCVENDKTISFKRSGKWIFFVRLPRAVLLLSNVPKNNARSLFLPKQVKFSFLENIILTQKAPKYQSLHESLLRNAKFWCKFPYCEVT